MEDISNKNILLFGTGKIGRNTCENLVKHTKHNHITLINRTKDKAEKLAHKLDVIVKEFTQKSLLVPVVVNNLPSDLSIRLVPENVTIRFEVAMEDYNNITAINFLLMCDFDKKNDQEDFMIPHLIKQPESIINLEIQENKINYLIFK